MQAGARGHVIANNKFETYQTPPIDEGTQAALASRIVLFGPPTDNVIYGHTGHFRVIDYRDATGYEPVRVAGAHGGAPQPTQLARADASGLQVPIPANAASVDILFHPPLVDPGLPAPGVPLYQVQVSPYWDARGWWIENKTPTGFTIAWQKSPGGNGSMLDWSAQWLPPQLASLAINPGVANVSLKSKPGVTLTAAGTFVDGTSADMTYSVIWAVSPPNLATIGDFGALTPTAVGVVTVTAMPILLSTWAQPAQPANPVVPAKATVTIVP